MGGREEITEEVKTTSLDSNDFKCLLPCLYRATQLEKRLEEKLQENETLRRQLEKVNNQLSLREEKDREREKTQDKGKQDVENKALTSGLLLSEAVSESSSLYR